MFRAFVGALVVVIVGAIAWQMRQASAKKRIQEFDDGTPCIDLHHPGHNLLKL